MVTHTDFKNRAYELIELRPTSTLLRCLTTGALVTVRSSDWSEIGMSR